MRLRRIDPEADFDAVLELVRASDEAVYGGSDWTPAELREEWATVDLDLDAWLAVEGDAVAGVLHRYDLRDGRVLGDAYVHPELAGRGAGTMLLEALEARAWELAGDVPLEQPVCVEATHLVGDERAPALFSDRAYERVRTFFRMTIELGDEPPPSPVWPAGLVPASLVPARDGPVVQAALDEAFAQEWGYNALPYAEWVEKTFGVDRFDASLCPLVWDGERLAGFSLNYPKRFGDWGWIGMLGVRPAWRRRGLGLTLLQESFRRFHERGERVVALGVDAENPTGATRLYERAGMGVLWQADVWRKVIREAAV